MSNEQSKTISAEEVQALKEKYNLPEGALREIVQSVRVTSSSLPSPAQEDMKPGEPEFMKQLMKGDLTMAEVLMWMDVQDRKERRERREERENNGGDKVALPTAAEIGREVSGALQNAGILGKPSASNEEIPAWAKPVIETQNKISKQIETEAAEKRDKDLIEKATGPLKTALAKTEEQIAQLSKPSPEGKALPKSAIAMYIEGRALLKDAGILSESQGKSNIMMIGPDGVPTTGIPVKGEIPAVVVYGPAIFNQILKSIETTADRIAAKYGLGVPPAKAEEKKPLIPLPKKPPAETKLPPSPATPTVTQPVEPSEPKKPLIALPEKEKIVPLKSAGEPVELTLEQPIKPEEPQQKTLPLPPLAPIKEEKKKPPLCAKCETPVNIIATARGKRNRCPKCRRFTKIKKSEENGPETQPNN